MPFLQGFGDKLEALVVQGLSFLGNEHSYRNSKPGRDSLYLTLSYYRWGSFASKYSMSK